MARTTTSIATLRQLLLVLPMSCCVVPAMATVAVAPAASGSQADALADRAWRYFFGQGVARDDSAAARLFAAAMEQGSVNAMYGLGLCYRLGRGVALDVPRSERLVKRALELGDPDAQVDAGETALAEDQAALAFDLFTRAAHQDNRNAMWQLGRLYLRDGVVPADPAKGLALLRQSAARGSAVGMYYLAAALRDAAAPDLAGARTWFARSAELGDPDARVELAGMMADGAGGPADVNGAIGLYRMGAAEAHRDSMYALASSYHFGEGVHRDYAEARRWLLKGVEQDDPRAMVLLGFHYLYGHDIPIDKPAAAALFARAAGLGNGRGIYMLAQCMEDGEGVARDPVGAAREYRRAAALGVQGAANRLLAMQLAGRAMPSERAAAVAAIDKTVAEGGAAQMLELAILLLRRDQDAEAGMVAGRALAGPAASRNTLAFAEILGQLGNVYFDRQQLGKADTYLRAHLVLLERLPDVPPTVLAAGLEKLGHLTGQQDLNDEAEALYQRALKLRLQADGEHDAGVANAYGHLATILIARDQLAQAEAHQRHKLDICEAIFGVGATQTAQARARLAQTLYLEGKYREAQPLFTEPLRTLEATLGASHPALRFPLNNLAYNDLAMGRHAEAEQAFRRVLAFVRADEKDPSHQLASALNGLGAALAGAGKFAEAEATLLAGLAMREQVLGKDHYDVAISLTNLGKLYIDMQRFADADRALARARPIVEAASGKAHSEVAVIEHQQGRSAYQQGRRAGARQLLAHALAIRLRTRPGHPDTAETAALLARLYRDEGNETSARHIEQQALAVAAPG